MHRALTAILLLLFGLACLAPAGARPSPARVWTADALTKVFPETPPRRPGAVSLEAACNEWESFQVIVRAEGSDLPGVSLSASDLRGEGGAVIPSTQVDVFREHYVRVERPSGNAIMLPREWPDALIPTRLSPTAQAAAGRNLAFWVTVRVPTEATPGRYRGEVVVRAAAGILARVPVTLRVHALTLPAANHQGATASLYYEGVRDYMNRHFRSGRPPLEEGSPEWQAIKERYYRFLLDYRLCAYDLPVSLESPEAEAFLRDERVNSFRVPWVHENPDHLRALTERLASLNALSRAFHYQADEPRREQYPDVRVVADRLRAANPRLRQLVTVFPTPELHGAVQIWCPDLGDTFGLGYLDPALLRARRAAGEETWWYTMCVPRHPYPTWLVDDDAPAHRAF